MSKLKVGDHRYYVPGYRGNGLLAILCTIKEIDNVDKHPDATIFYWVDEPIGHGLTADDLMTQDTAVEVLMSRYEDACKETLEDESALADAQLAEYRKESQAFIASTWEANGSKHPGFDPLPDKEPWEEWISPQMVFDKRKLPIKGSAILLDGVIYSVLAPGRHNHAIAKALAENPKMRFVGGTQGFITQDDRFVDRIEGAKIALESGQIPKLNYGGQLYSEDLW